MVDRISVLTKTSQFLKNVNSFPQKEILVHINFGRKSIYSHVLEPRNFLSKASIVLD